MVVPLGADERMAGWPTDRSVEPDPEPDPSRAAA
jgi:hypothetical protein